MTDHPTDRATPTSSTFPQRVHFPGLNSIRFYAAFAVLVEHVNAQVSTHTSLYRILASFFINGENAVNLFFVLSGFLITYLLLHEWMITGRINIKYFYIRRALRILPLYYWVVLLGLVIFPIFFGSSYPLADLPMYKIILTVGLMPHFAVLTIPLIHLWSIGVEEQFYAFWPWACRSDTMILRVSIGIIILKIFLAIMLTLLNDSLTQFIIFTLRFESMAIGALGAYIYRKNLSLLNWIYRPLIQLFALGGFAYLAVFHVHLNQYSSMVSALVFIILIVNIATNPESILKLNLPFMEKLGEVSYGFYMYHFPALYLVWFAASKAGFDGIRTSPFLLLGITFVITLAMAVMSFRWLESPFLRLKKKLTPTFITGDQIKYISPAIQ